MCGIVGYIGGRNAADVVLDGLKRLEYRGYDSAGLAILGQNGIEVTKEVGKVSDLVRSIAGKDVCGNTGVGHTRWATHGGVTKINAHPHSDRTNTFTLVHNGIIENYLELKEELENDGCTFVSQTDTEVIVALLAKIYKGDLLGSVVELQRRLRGSYALVILCKEHPDKFLCARKGSPLVLGVGENETLCASDVPALLSYTNKVMYLNDGEMAELTRDGCKVFDMKGNPIKRDIVIIDWDIDMAEKDGYPHFMLKEINEQGAVLRSTLKGRIHDGAVDFQGEIDWSLDFIKSLKKIHLVACGTSYYAALVAERILEQWTDLDVRVDIASEYRYRHIKIDKDTLAVFVSQSGETADTLAASRLARASGARCLAVTNARGSTLAREVHDVLLLKAGLEIGVAATKTFTGQMGALYLLALKLGYDRGNISAAEAAKLTEGLLKLPYDVENTIARVEEVKKLAAKYAHYNNFLFLGRGISFPIALEGALKLKEISYVHAEAYAAGEMKHGPIALLEPAVPVMTVIPRDGLYEKTLSNIQEARARLSPILAVASDGDNLISHHTEDALKIPVTDDAFTPFLSVIPLQQFAYYMALNRGKEIDQPRNLAKSVTVE